MTESYIRALSKPFISASLGVGIFILGATTSFAASTDAKDPEAAKYAACVGKLQDTPEAALDMATAWRARGGGIAAKHCIALALISLKKYEQGAKGLEEVAEDLKTGHGTFGLADADNSRLLPEVYSQAGNAWLMAGNYTHAYNILSAGLAETPPWSKLLADLLLDRARALVGMGQYDTALFDLSKARDAAPDRADVRVYRAAALRALKRPAEAGAELTVALRLEPDNPDALLERGSLFLAVGDDVSARGDWLKVIATYPGSPEAEVAQNNIRLLKDKPPAPTQP